MPLLDSLGMDLRYALRSLRRSPVFALVSILSIAGGLAAGTGLFTFAYGLMYRPLGVGDGRQLHEVFTANRGGSRFGSSSYLDYLSFRESPVIASGCAIARVRGTLTVEGAAAIHQGEMVDPGCFETFRLVPAAGRFFGAADASGTPNPIPVIIGHQLWQRRFGGDAAAIGRVVALNGAVVSIAAVAPAGFAGTSLDGGAEFWAPVAIAPALLPPGALDRDGPRSFSVFVRLRDGVGSEQAEAALAVVAERLRADDTERWTDANGATRRVTVMRETDARFGDTPGGALGLFGAALAAIALIVAIACLNLSTMLLARGAARTRELAVRLAIGASYHRVLRQLATESLLIATLGALLALAMVLAGVRLFEAYRPAGIPAFDVAFDWRVVAFALLLTVVASLLFGMAPALHSLRLALAEGLKGGLPARRVRRARVGPRDVLIVVQVAVSSALLLVATLFAGALARGAPASPGFTVQGIAAVETHLDALPAAEHAAVDARLLDAARRLADVDGVTSSAVVPMSGSNSGFYVEAPGVERRVAYGNVVAPGYFSTLGIAIRSGRDFGPSDGPGGRPVVIVSEALALELFGTTQALGRAVVMDSVPREVVGVVADIHYISLSKPVTPLVYLPLAQQPQDRLIIHARYRGGPATLAALERVLRETDPRVAVETATPIEAVMARALIGERATQLVGAAVGAVQLFLALMALWGLVAYAVERRTLEMGVRLALGATPSSLVRLTMRPAVALIALGVLLGSAAGSAIARVVQSQSFGLAPLDLRAILPVALAFSAVAMLAAWWPARRAGRADPAESLRRE
jgi:predicted permease